MTYQVTKDLETGNTIIDSEHRELFRAVNQLMEECGKGKGRASLEPTAKFLLDYVDKHFAHEEDLQRKYQYPSMATHHIFHENYKRKLRDIANQIMAHDPTVTDLSNLNAHIGVLVSHIKTEDKRLGAFLREKTK